MNLSDIKLLYDYNHWANRLLLEKSALVTQEQFSAPTTHSWGSLRGTLWHTLDTEWSWRTFCETGTFPPELPLDNFPDVEAIRLGWEAEEAAWQAYLESLTEADLTSIKRYTIASGAVRERVLWHILWHVVNHGMQHRSESAHMLTQYGQSPGDLDFTVYLNFRNGVT
jgi:uncharacterized damage-inducible protein DinB